MFERSTPSTINEAQGSALQTEARSSAPQRNDFLEPSEIYIASVVEEIRRNHFEIQSKRLGLDTTDHILTKL